MESAATVAKPMAKVIPLPLADRSCLTCNLLAYLPDDQGTMWCQMNDLVVDEPTYEAEDCGGYERVEEGSQAVLADDPREP